MKIIINVRKTYVLAVLSIAVLVAVVIAQTTPNPGHTASQINVNTQGKTLQEWSTTIQNQADRHDTDIVDLQNGLPQIEVGPEIYLGRSSFYANDYESFTNLNFSYNGIHAFRFHVLAGGSNTCPDNTDVICGTANSQNSVNWACTCTPNGQASTPLVGVDCSSRNPDWITFKINPFPPVVGNNILKDGFSNIGIMLCDKSTDAGNEVVDIYVQPYVMRTDGYRISSNSL